MPVKCSGYCCDGPSKTLKKWDYTVRDPRSNDVVIDVHYCGLCHTDLHMMNDDWKCSQYPLVPGHEVVGVVSQAGDACKKLKVGDKVGVGYIAWSCRECEACKSNQEQYCPKFVQSYGFPMPDGEVTRGGFSNTMVVPEEFAIKIPQQFGLEYAAPLLCAGITVYSPMVYAGCQKGGMKIGVVGLGGLGHMVLKFGVAMGNEVTVISTSARKAPLAKELGASNFIDISQPDQVKGAVDTLNFIINTVAAEQDLDMLLSFLKPQGSICAVGLPETSIKYKIAPPALIFKRKTIFGSLVGSVTEQEEMMTFCTQKNVLPMIEVISMKQVNEALQRLERNDVKFRFVLDLKN